MISVSNCEHKITLGHLSHPLLLLLHQLKVPLGYEWETGGLLIEFALAYLLRVFEAYDELCDAQLLLDRLD